MFRNLGEPILERGDQKVDAHYGSRVKIKNLKTFDKNIPYKLTYNTLLYK